MPGKSFSVVARVIANPTGAQVLDALLSDRALTVTDLAAEIGMARSTVSEAIGMLAAAGLVVRSRDGRSTLVRLAGDDVADALEALGRIAPEPAPIGLRAVNRTHAMRRARTCYDHLAGELGIALARGLLGSGVLSTSADGSWQLTSAGRQRLITLGVDASLIQAEGRRPLVRACDDWTERQPHVAGRVGAAICTAWLQTGAVQRMRHTRALSVTAGAEAWLSQLDACGDASLQA